MKDTETQAVHVRIMPSEAVDCKKNLLEIELHSLNILKTLIVMKDLRKKEFRLKKEARSRMREMAREIDKTLNELPHVEALPQKGKGKKKFLAIEEITEEKERSKAEKIKIEEELLRIKKELEKLV